MRVSIRVSSALLLLLCSFSLAPPTALGQDKRYTIDDLEALVKSAAWDEAAQHLEDIPPSRRDARWQKVVEKTAIGQLRALDDLEKRPLEAVELADAYMKRLPFLAKNRPFMQVRGELGLKGFDKCNDLSWEKEKCTDLLLPFVEADAGNIDLATRAARLRAKQGYSYHASPYWRLVAEWGKGSKKACTTELLPESTLAAMALASGHEMLEPGLEVADLCFPYLKTRLQAGAGESRATRNNICPLLRKKNAVGNAKCAGS
jgi:hypothetical protein